MPELPENLVNSYYEMVKEKILIRLTEDSDFVASIENGKAKD